MNTPAEKTQEIKSQSVANEVSQKRNTGESALSIIDNSPEAIMQRKMQEVANNSPQVKQAAQLQATANNFLSSPSVGLNPAVIQRTTWRWTGDAWENAGFEGEEESEAPERDGYYNGEFVDTAIAADDDLGGAEEEAEAEAPRVRADPRLNREYPYGGADEEPHIHAYGAGFHLQIRDRGRVRRYNIVQGGQRHAQADMALGAAEGNDDLVALIQNILDTQL